MTIEERVRFLLRIASRAEVEGNERASRLFRRMAEESQPLEVGWFDEAFHPAE